MDDMIKELVCMVDNGVISFIKIYGMLHILMVNIKTERHFYVSNKNLPNQCSELLRYMKDNKIDF